jgi:acyl-coenzyme A synthetase/AMP-(fatty) acid ligase
MGSWTSFYCLWAVTYGYFFFFFSYFTYIYLFGYIKKKGATTVLFEGKPTVPSPGIFWKVIEKYKVNALYTAPTALRAIRKSFFFLF